MKASTSSDPQPSTSGIKRKSEDKKPQGQPENKKGLWLGVDLTESDLESSSDEEEDDVKPKETKKAISCV